MADDSGSKRGKRQSKWADLPMNYPDESHPIFSNPIVVGPGAVWKKSTKTSESPSGSSEPQREEPSVEE